MGLTNYYSCYVKGYAALAAPLMELLKVGRTDGKKGSKKPVAWTPESEQAFRNLKAALASELELYQLDPDQPFILRTDASDFAIGAVLEQERDGRPLPVAFYSRKLTGSQMNWTPRQKETYAIVAALRKWAGWIDFQPVVVKTDHRSLEHWVSEHVDTPSGPRGRRARWHETMSDFKLHVHYIPGKENEMADAMSRYAYPASSAKDDVSFHGSAENREQVKKMLEQELREGREVGLVRLTDMGDDWNGDVFFSGDGFGDDIDPVWVNVVTRSGKELRDSSTDTSEDGESTDSVSTMTDQQPSNSQPQGQI